MGKSFLNFFTVFASARLAIYGLRLVFHFAYDLPVSVCFSPPPAYPLYLKLNFHLNTCPTFWSLAANTHSHTHPSEATNCAKLVFAPAQLMTKNLLVSACFSFFMRDCKSKQLEGQLGFMTRNWVGLLAIYVDCKRSRQ